MNRLVAALLVSLALFLATDARAQVSPYGQPGTVVNPYTPNPYSGSSWQLRPPYPYPPYPYPYYVPPAYYYFPIDPNPQYDWYTRLPLPPIPGTANTDTITMPDPKENRAVINVLLPSFAADVWVDDQKMSDKLDNKRVYISPPLEPGHDYVYTVKARWVQRGQNVTHERPVIISANKTSTVDFSKPPGK
jgi:uncharacterized protein (TIGR03000 family)